MVSVHLGVDIGGTTTDAVLVDEAGALLHRHTRASGRGAAGIVDEAAAAVAALSASSGIALDRIASIGVGVPGAVVDGVVRAAQNLDVDRLDLASELARRWGRRPVVDNDVTAAALGAWSACGSTHGSLALLNLGTGLAAGFVLDGRVWRGARGAAGEIGHISVDPNGPAGDHTPPGGLEVYASGSGIAHQAGGEPAPSVLARADVDADAAAIRERLYLGVASAVRLIVLTLDVELVVLGGGLTHLGEPLLDGVRRVVDGWRGDSPFLDAVDLQARMHLLDPEVPVAAIGAAMRGAGRG